MISLRQVLKELQQLSDKDLDQEMKIRIFDTNYGEYSTMEVERMEIETNLKSRHSGIIEETSVIFTGVF